MKLRDLNFWHLSLLVILPLLANAPVLSGIFKCDPELLHSGLGIGLNNHLYPGAACYVDPAVAYITQPLAYLSAQDWLHGLIPWWNPYTGVGVPMAAEMQDESFFLPFVLLLHFHQGWLLQRLIFQALTGLFSYWFMCDIGIFAGAALLGAIIFVLNGTFILTASMVAAPIFCLPLMLLGVERIRVASLRRLNLGWSFIAAGLALSIYAGFPEMAYFDGLLVAGWSILRFFQLPYVDRWRFAAKLATGGLVGLALSGPLTNAFIQYLNIAYIGSHSGTLAHSVLPPMAAPLQLFPLFYGALAEGPPAGLSDAGLWVRIGGWIGCVPTLLGLYALLVKSECKAVRWFLAGWILAWQARYFGLPGFIYLFNLVPGMDSADIVRYSTVTVEFSAFILAAFGLQDLGLGKPLTRQNTGLLIAVCATGLLVSVLPVRSIMPIWWRGYPHLAIISVIFGILSIFGIFVTMRAIFSHRSLGLVKVYLLVSSIGVFWISQIGAPRSGHLDLAGVSQFNPAHDYGRLYTVGPFAASFPAMYHLAEINYQQLPIPRLWTDYISSFLFPDADLVTFGGGQVGQADDFLSHATSFEAIGVKYLITSPGQSIFKDHNPNASLSWNGYVPVLHHRAVGTVVPPGIVQSALISSVSVVVGTYYGKSTLPIYVKLCDVSGCAKGSESLAKAGDNQPLVIALAQPLKLIAGESLSVQFFHPAGQQVAVWLPTGLSRSDYALEPLPDGSSRLVMNKVDNLPSVPRIFHDNTMDIYQLPNPAPYAQSNDDACHVVIYSRQKMDSDCPHPTTMVRRELYYPGWRAQVNGVDIPITQTENIFQRINLPAGPAKIRFTYIPPYTPLACAAAIAAALFWLAAGILSRRRHAKN